MPDFICKFNNEWWNVIVQKLDRLELGDADYDHRQIRIDESLTGDKLFTTAIHEGIHAQYPFLVESEVERGGVEMAEFIKLLIQTPRLREWVLEQIQDGEQ